MSSKTIMFVALSLLGCMLSVNRSAWATNLGTRELDPATLDFTMMPMAKAQVEAVDWGRSEMTLSHAHIYDINLPAGTSVFHVLNSALLDQYSPGNSVYLLTERRGERLTLIRLSARHRE